MALPAATAGAAGSPASASAPAGTSFNAIVGPGDLTGDQRADVLARRARPPATSGSTPATAAAAGCPASRVGTGWNIFNAIVGPGDLTGDGRADLLAREPSTGYLWLYPGNGRGGWLPRVRVGTGWNGMTALTSAGDLNGDRAPDVLARDRSGDLWLYPRTGDRHVAAAACASAPAGTPSTPSSDHRGATGERAGARHTLAGCAGLRVRTGRGIRRRPAPGGRAAASEAARSPSSPSAITAARQSLPRGSISLSSTWTFWPTLRTSSTLSIRLPPTSLRTSEMCSRPSLPGRSEMNAPKVVVLTTVPEEALADLGHLRVGDGVDHRASRLGRRAVGRTDVDGAVVLDRDVGAGLVLDLVDHLALRADDLADLVDRDLHR